MRQKHMLAAALLAAIPLLSSCGQRSEAPDPQAEALNNRPALKELPPSIVASRVYRCADRSVVYVDFMNNQTASLRKTQTDTPTLLRADAQDGPYAGAGFTVSANADTIRYTAPGKAEQGCHK